MGIFERGSRRLCGAINAALASSALMVAAGAASAAVITVDSAADADPSFVDGTCTLREAILSAETDAPVDVCAAGNGDDIIGFAAELAGGTITVVNDLDFRGTQASLVTGDVDGDGDSDITLSGGGSERVAFIHNDAFVTLQHMVITEGYWQGFGGGIYNRGVLSISGSTLQNNNAGVGGGAIGNQPYAVLTVLQSTLRGNSGDLGGAIHNAPYGVVIVRRSTLTENSGNAGGGIENRDHATLRVLESTLSGNTAGLGGGIANDSYGTVTIGQSTLSGNTAEIRGGAIYNDHGELLIRNSTITDNVAYLGGALSLVGGIVGVNHATIAGNTADNGGGIMIHGSANVLLDMHGSIIANNVGGNCVIDAGGTFVNNGSWNLFYPSVDDCTGGTLGDPKLGPLADNGGPTHTMLPGPSSEAIDSIPFADGVWEDQRSVQRILAGSSDIGAVEVIPMELDLIFADGFD